MQGRRQDTSVTNIPVAPTLLLLPGSLGQDSQFPIEHEANPEAEASSPQIDVFHTNAPDTGFNSPRSKTHHVIARERHEVIEEQAGDVVYHHETEIVYVDDGRVHTEEHEFFTEQPTELTGFEHNEIPIVGTDEATAGSAETSEKGYLEVTVPHLHGGDEWQTTRPVLPPVNLMSSPLGPHGTELSAIDPVEETGLSATTPLVTQISLPRKESRDDWFTDEPSSQVQKTPSVEISILGHPVGAQKSAKSLPPLEEFTATLEYLRAQDSNSSSHALVSVRRAITQCVDLGIVKDEPVARALFCEAMEAVSFNEGPLREAAMDAVGILMDCLDESSVLADTEEDRISASAALGALWNLTFTSKGEVSDSDILNAAKKAMLSFPHDEDVQVNASGLFVNLAADKHSQERVLNLGCMEALVAAVTTHPDNVSLVEHACQLMTMISARRDLRQQLPSAYREAVLEVAGTLDDPGVKRWCNWLKSLSTP